MAELKNKCTGVINSVFYSDCSVPRVSEGCKLLVYCHGIVSWE